MKFIDLENLQLKTFTESDALDYCQLNNINPLNITELYLSYNELTNISGIKLFKNLEYLNLYYNKIKDISVLKDLKNLEYLYINNNQIKDISVLKDLKNLKYLDIGNLLLESSQIKYIKKLERLYSVKGFKDISVLNKLNNVV